MVYPPSTTTVSPVCECKGRVCQVHRHTPVFRGIGPPAGRESFLVVLLTKVSSCAHCRASPYQSSRAAAHLPESGSGPGQLPVIA